MSMQVFNAYRVKGRGYNWDLLWEIRDQARSNIQKKMVAVYKEMVRTVIYNDEEYQPEKDSRFERLSFVRDQLEKKVKEAEVSLRRDSYDVHVSLTVSPYKGRLYLRSFCDGYSALVGGCLDFLEGHPKLEDFYYQSSSDRPKKVPKAEWEARKEVWEALTPNHHWNQLTLDICSLQNPVWNTWLTFGEADAKDPQYLPSLEELAVEHLLQEAPRFSPKVDAEIVGPGHIQGPGYVIRKEGDLWMGTSGELSYTRDSLRAVVGWVKSQFMSQEDREYLDSIIKRVNA